MVAVNLPCYISWQEFEMDKCCGNCMYWLKLKSIKGLCDKMDLGWANSDHGAGCKEWKRKRDDKPRGKIRISQIEI